MFGSLGVEVVEGFGASTTGHDFEARAIAEVAQEPKDAGFIVDDEQNGAASAHASARAATEPAGAGWRRDI